MRENEFKSKQSAAISNFTFLYKKQHGHRGYYAECFYEAKGFI